MFSYSDSFEQPATVKIGEREITLPLLSQRDYLPWIEEVTKVRQENARKNAPPVGKAVERSKWMDWADNMEITPADLQPYVLRASGTIKVLEMALRKAKVDDDDAVKFIDGQGAKANEMLAVRVSGLFRKEEIALMYPVLETKKDEPDPNASKANPENLAA